jgi:hypothetical protein
MVKEFRSFGFARPFARLPFPLNDAHVPHYAEQVRTLPRVDKLGVTGSSPVPPTEKPCIRAFLLLQQATVSQVVARTDGQSSAISFRVTSSCRPCTIPSQDKIAGN